MRYARPAGEELETHRARLFQVPDAAVGHAADASQSAEDRGVHLAPQGSMARRIVQVLHHHHSWAWHFAYMLVERCLVAVLQPAARADGSGRGVAHHGPEVGKDAADVHRHVALVPGPDCKCLDGVAERGRVETL